MNLFVLDASVAAKWFLPPHGEPLAAEAWEILKLFQKDEIRFLVPDLFWAELGNVLWKAVRQGRFASGAAEEALRTLRLLQLPAISNATLVDTAFALACTHGRTVYDCIYLALAVEARATLLTADEQFAHALAARFPIKWLGAFPV